MMGNPRYQLDKSVAGSLEKHYSLLIPRNQGASAQIGPTLRRIISTCLQARMGG